MVRESITKDQALWEAFNELQAAMEELSNAVRRRPTDESERCLLQFREAFLRVRDASRYRRVDGRRRDRQHDEVRDRLAKIEAALDEMSQRASARISFINKPVLKLTGDKPTDETL